MFSYAYPGTAKPEVKQESEGPQQLIVLIKERIIGYVKSGASFCSSSITSSSDDSE